MAFLYDMNKYAHIHIYINGFSRRCQDFLPWFSVSASLNSTYADCYNEP